MKLHLRTTVLTIAGAACLLTACSLGTGQTAEPTAAPSIPGSGVFFDDFNYSSSDDPTLAERGWTVRIGGGGPGVPGATWLKESVTFFNDSVTATNHILQLESSTDGTAASTIQTELFQERKFYEGTYASRVRFSDTPVAGPDGDQVVQTFFTITPLNYALEPDYGEIDFEYLPNGGWGSDDHVFWMTTWETYQSEPWVAESDHNNVPESFTGWHTLVAQVAGNTVTYYIDGQQLAQHGEAYYPETPMSINFNQWFIDEGLIDDPSPRSYRQQVDWLYYAGNETLTPEQVETRIANLRAQRTAHTDTVPSWRAPAVTIPATVTAAPTGPRPFEQSIPRVREIQVDGVLSDWLTDPVFIINDDSQIVYISPDTVWGGPADLSAQVWAGWNEDGLYLAAAVTDDVIIQTETDGNLWQGDYLELQLDLQLDEDFYDTRMNEDDLQLGFSPGNFADVEPAAFIWSGPITTGQMREIQQAQTQVDGGYVIEVYIPGSLLPGLGFTEGATLGLNVNPSDSDGEPQEVMMSTSPIRQLNNPTTLGKIILGGE